ncbi:hypothetical protein MNBD_BACTEROID01-457 [hydrothermal vent metagenome]|uniref:Uncharacterized protein n=1 Tax=hydrothermal vent metagenome TaxID=652676 RepID=A0A3B0U638_9ZZZZ
MVRGELVDKSTNFQIRNFGKDTLLFSWIYEKYMFFWFFADLYGNKVV